LAAASGGPTCAHPTRVQIADEPLLRTEPTAEPRVLVAHNHYRYYGGEDAVVEAEVALLRRFGHPIELYSKHSDETRGLGPVALAGRAIWSRPAIQELREIVARFRPQIIHVHNVVPLISPAIYWVAAQAGIPVVQTVHNYRLHCLRGTYFRDGKACEDCLGRGRWRGVVHRCYQSSMLNSLGLAATLSAHDLLGSFRRKVDLYLALTAFARRKLIEGGLPAERVVVKPNFVDVPDPVPHDARTGGLFVGRLTEDKGLRLLMEVGRSYRALAVAVAGEGPLEHDLRLNPAFAMLGWKPREGIYQQMARAQYLVLPSIGYEGFPRVVVEAFGSSLPVIASRVSGLDEIIEDGRTGLLFDAGSAKSLEERLRWADAHPHEMRAMGERARAQYVARYSAERGYRNLMDVYQQVLAGKGGSRAPLRAADASLAARSRP
jgi:glycosyltransferase involved in cell wall biosynthesis